MGHTLAESVNGRTTTYAYDALGRCIRRVVPSGLTSQWTYDPAGRAIELRSEAGVLAFDHDVTGRETRRRVGDRVTLTQCWDAADRLTVQSLTAMTSVLQEDRLLQHRAYTHRADGYITEIRDLTSGTRRFDLDDQGRVTGVRAHGWSEGYAYDTAGNLTHAAAPGHDDPGEREFDGNLIHRVGRTTYEYDAAGRLIRRARKLLNGKQHTWTYAWNAEDRLTEAVTPDGDHWRYTYDPLGRRMSKSLLAEDGSAATRTDFVWDDTRLAEQCGPDGTVTTWDYAPGTHLPLTQTDHRAVTRAPGKSVPH
ncbi:hypothetical protein ABZV34_20810 [Streptomyces sp. NPDC005195]|uniref:hypothetical protein n=1 Tax=Streptomyces sp. NPDC005195 TaxID=3154561 RepID=UPI0033A0C1C7